jgi:adenylate cyclase
VFRIGINIGDIIVDGDDIYGDGVNVAARLESLAEPGGLCVARNVFDQVKDKLNLTFVHQGDKKVKNITEPVSVYRVVFDDKAAALVTPIVDEMAKPSRWRLPIAAAAAVLLVAVGGVIWWQPWAPEFAPAEVEAMALPLPDKPSIAVLAFDSLGENPEQEALSDAISDNIITELSHFSELFVIARNSSFSYKGKPVKVRQVAEELGVRYVLEGSLQRSADRVRVTVRLIDALAGNHVWAQVYDRQLEDIFEIQDEIARTVAATVEEKVEVRERDRVMAAHPASLEAFEYWMRGTKHWFEWTEEGNDKAQLMYTKAVELDPNMARGYLGLAWVYINGFSNGWTELSREEALKRARELAQKGLELAPYDYFPHQTMGYVHMQAGEREQAIARQKKAIELNPNAGYPMMDLGETLIYAGRAPEAIVWFQKAMRLNPHHPDWFYWSQGKAEYAAGHYEEAAASMQKMNVIPNRARHILAAAYVQVGRLDEANAIVKTILEKNPEYSLEKLRLYFAEKYKDPTIPKRYIEDLRKAGLPE